MEKPSNIKSFFIYIFKILLYPFNKGVNKQFLIYLLFLLISLMFWLLQSLDDEKEIDVLLPVEYVNIPQDMIFTEDPSSILSVKLSDKSLNLFKYMFRSADPIKIDLSLFPQDKERVVLSREDLISIVKKELNPSTKLVSFYSDSIVLMYANNEGKSLPVKIKSNYTISNNSVQTGDIKISPSMVSVYADSSRLSKIKEVESELLVLKNITDTIVTKVKLKDLYGVRIEPSEVEVTIPIEEYIGKKLTLDINNINFPKDTSVITFPARAEVEVLIPMSQYTNTNESKFQLYVDYKDYDSNNTKLPLKISTKPDYVYRISLNPESVEYILNIDNPLKF